MRPYRRRQRREGPLVDFKIAEDFEKWLEGKPREVAVALAARAVLRVLPRVWMARNASIRGDFRAVIVLPVFRATGVAWSAAKYPDQATKLQGFAAPAAEAAFTAASANAAAHAADTIYAAARAAERAAIAIVVNSTHNAAAATDYAADATNDTAAFWSALSSDATRIQDKRVKPEVVASSALWPQASPPEINELWQEMKRDLRAAGHDWDVWLDWYDARLDGLFRDEKRERAYVLIFDDLWKAGPAIVNAEIKRRIEPLQPAEEVPPEPAPEPGPVLQVSERGLELISEPLGGDFEENLQKGLHDRLRCLLPSLTDETRKVANRYPALDHVIAEYADLVERPFDQLNVGSIWMVGTGLLAFRAAFANQPSSTMTEPLEPGHMALLQQVAEIHGAFILGFPKGRELTDRADQARLSPEIIAQIAVPTRTILDDLAGWRHIVEEETRKTLSAIDDSLIVHGWETARVGHAAYVITRNSLIALGKYLIITNVGCAAVFGQPIIPAINMDPNVTQQIVAFMIHHAQDVLGFAQPFPELRVWIAAILDHIDQEKKS
ncbi:MAG: hypothetical protein WA208_18160 [Thermoanaerobaculia bacterium]